jgi:hypothetical protein
MGLVKRWKHGGTEYPLDAATDDDFLKVADPAVYYTLRLFESAINAYAGDALLARAAAEGLNFPSAVRKMLHYEPTPHLLADQMEFPLLCVYRSKEQWDEKSASHQQDASVWEWAYVLPPLTPRQIDKLNPILRSISAIVSSFAMQSYDAEGDFEGGATLRDLSGIQKMAAGTVSYGNFEPVDGNGQWWKAVTGQMLVSERSSIVEEAFPSFEGANLRIDMDDGETKVEGFIEANSPDPLTLTDVSPVAGTKAGNALVYLTGTGFPTIGEPPRVLFGGAYASSVIVLHPTRLQCLTPEHDAYPTQAVDVQVIGADGQESNVLEDAYTFTSP